jgi:cysteine-rich repeat protein
MRTRSSAPWPLRSMRGRASVAAILLLAACGGGEAVDSLCGNGEVDGGEQCDDGNTASGDGCSAGCQDEGECGDGVRNTGEECDDANTAGGDGCDDLCRVEGSPNASPEQLRAFQDINSIRASAGLAGLAMDDDINEAAQNHADCFVNNPEDYLDPNNDFVFIFNPHEEAQGFTFFSGAQFFDRMAAAGFSGAPMFEVMAFSDDPDAAVGTWLNSVFHRVPLLHPNTAQMGYGGASGARLPADVVDFGSGVSADASQIVLFPPPGATGVIGAFDTRFEGPNPPRPPGGGTVTGPIISVLFDASVNAEITSRELFDGDGDAVDTTLVDPGFGGGLMLGSFAFYGDGPARSGETFTAAISGTLNGQAFERSWSFTVE